MLSISSLLRSIKRLDCAVPAVEEPEFSVSLLVRTPSITIKGWLLPIMEVTPRTRIREPPPAEPEERVICTPAALPTKASIALLLPELEMSSLFTVCTA